MLKSFSGNLSNSRNMIRIGSSTPFIFRIVELRAFLQVYIHIKNYKFVTLGRTKYVEFYLKKKINVKNFMDKTAGNNLVTMRTKLLELNNSTKIWICSNKGFNDKKTRIKKKLKKQKNKIKNITQTKKVKTLTTNITSPNSTISEFDVFRGEFGGVQDTHGIMFQYKGRNKKLENIIQTKFKIYKSFNTIPSSNEFRRVLINNCTSKDDLIFFTNNYEKVLSKIHRLNNELRNSLLVIDNYQSGKVNFGKILKKLTIYEVKCKEQFEKISEKFARENQVFKKNFCKIPNFLASTKFKNKSEPFLKYFEDLQEDIVFNRYFNQETIAREEMGFLKKKFFFLYYNEEILLDINLQKYDHLYIDGTRDICEITGLQLVPLTIKKNGYKGKQIIFCLTNKYDENTYKKILEKTLFFFENGKHLTVHADFECALFSATRPYFKSFIPCYFHFTKIITDNFKKYLEKKRVSAYDKISNLLKLVYFCSKKNLEVLFKYIESQANPDVDAHMKIINHIKRNFYGNGRFSKFVGYKYNDEMTNNTAEWFHMYIKGIMTHKGVFHLVQIMEGCLRSGYFRDLKKKEVTKRNMTSLKVMANLLLTNDYSRYSPCDFKKIIEEYITPGTNMNTTLKNHEFRH